MNSSVIQWINRPCRMRLITVSLLAIGLAVSGPARAQTGVAPGLIAHEWGTFTSVAGQDGRAVEWSPLSLPIDLPEFVEHFNIIGLKVGLRGTVRMETPVLYFYSSRDLTLSVHVDFSRGLITEWYPHAAATLPPGQISSTMLRDMKGNGGITWDSVSLNPGASADFPQDAGYNGNIDSRGGHYYMARSTSSTPLSVPAKAGEQPEKFLFYRGVAAFQPPISAAVDARGSLRVTNPGFAEIPAVILFERRGDRIGYRVFRGLEKGSLLQPPQMNDGLDSLYSDMEQILEAQGLYQDEAHAMVQTWSNSWFEEGSRLFYIVPRHFLDTILPLTINPSPAQTVRVFVGRMEIVSPATRQAVEAALAANDQATLEKYGRFLEPIMRAIEASHPDGNQ
jgi:hypothetical protein